MKKLIITALVCLSVVGVATGSSLAANGNGPAPKATGDLWFTNGTLGPAHWVFNAIGGTTAKGHVFYEDQTGYYTGDVTSVSVNGQDATFSAVVTFSTNPNVAEGATETWTVHDVAEPGVGNDYFTYLYSGGSIDLPAITAGNIQVHA
jgi:hypothetical protein